MPSKIAGFTLTRRPGSANWCCTWYDTRTRQTRRASLGTSDVREAEQRLAARYVANVDVRDQHPAVMPLAFILDRYWHQHACKLPSAVPAKIELRRITDFFGDVVLSDLTPTRQEAFHDHLRAKGLSEGSISRNLATLRAAIKRAHKRGEVLAVPFIADVETAQDKRAKDPKGRRITLQELVALFEAADRPHVRMFLLLACCTLARPDAILDLTVFQRDDGVLHLNPRGRRQTKKYRPSVPIAATLKPWLDAAEGPHFVQYCGRRLQSIKSAWRRLRAAAGLDDDVTPYSVRHSMARELRRRGVPMDQIGQMLGHVRRSTTAIYAPDEPEHLSDAVAAIDAVMADVDRVAARSITRIVSSVVSSSASKVVGAAGIEPATPTMST
jgi:integrase